MSLRIGVAAGAVLGAVFVLGALGWALLGPTRALGTPLVGRPAPDLVVRTFDGQRVGLGEMRGRPVVLNFWASWCAPCRTEMPVLSQSAKAHSGQVGFLGVDVRDSDGAARAFLEQTAPTYPVGIAVSGTPSAYGVDAALPQTFFIDQRGRVQAHSAGQLTGIAVEGYLKELVG